MRPTAKLLAGGAISALGLAACSVSNGNSATTTTVPPVTMPANSPAGFNAAHTAFNLPFKLGVLPADELALAKADPAYAAGLAKPNDWMRSNENLFAPTGSNAELATRAPTWYYVGSTSGSESAAVVDVKNTEMGWNATIVAIYNPASMSVVHSSPIAIDARGLHAIVSSASFAASALPANSLVLVAPSNLEIQAAPVGTLQVRATAMPAFCVPMPYAWVYEGKLANQSGMPAMNAGPSTVFAGPNVTASPSSPLPGGEVGLYDEGVASCANFN